jgi:hypothetical protein
VGIHDVEQNTSRHHRAWTKGEIALLYGYASQMTQEEAGALLGRTRKAVNQMVHKLGIVWGQGTWNPEQIAKIVECRPPTVIRAIKILYRPQDLIIAGTDKMPRFKLTDEQADRVIRVMQATREHRKFHIAGGLARGRQLRAQRLARSESRAD